MNNVDVADKLSMYAIALEYHNVAKIIEVLPVISEKSVEAMVKEAHDEGVARYMVFNYKSPITDTRYPWMLIRRQDLIDDYVYDKGKVEAEWTQIKRLAS